MQCPICGAPAKHLTETAEGLAVDCPRCGAYQVTDSCLNAMLRLDLRGREQALEAARKSSAAGEVPIISSIATRPWWQRLWRG
jgi:hypothetical protein